MAKRKSIVTRLTIEVLSIALVALVLILIAFGGPTTLPALEKLADPIVRHVLTALLLLAVMAFLADVYSGYRQSRAQHDELRLREKQLEMKKAEIERAKRELELRALRIITTLNSRAPLDQAVKGEYSTEAQALYDTARRLRSAEPPDVDLAIKLFIAAYSKDNRFWHSLINAALLQINGWHFKAAEEQLDKVLQGAPENSEREWAGVMNMTTLYNGRFLAFRDVNDAKNAVRWSERAWDIFTAGQVRRPDAEKASLTNLIASNSTLGRFDEAAKWTREYVRRGYGLSNLEGAIDENEIDAIAIFAPDLAWLSEHKGKDEPKHENS